MSYYDDEAAVYDETRGGVARAEAAARAITSLVPGTGNALDVAGGTGIVTAQLAECGWRVCVLDRSVGMLREAAPRLPGRVLAGSATQLPVRDESVDLVTAIWLLHLMSTADADLVIAEAARVLRPGGHLVTTVDKDLAHGRVRRTDGDHADRVTAVASRAGLRLSGTTWFAAETQWRSAPTGQVFPVVAYRKDRGSTSERTTNGG